MEPNENTTLVDLGDQNMSNDTVVPINLEETETPTIIDDNISNISDDIMALVKADYEVMSFDFAEKIQLKENTMGMTVTSGTIVIKKDANNLIGISIGGGAPLCPCLYIVQIFDNTAASKDGTLQSGDELVAVNNQLVKGKTKVEVAKMIQAAKDEVVINYNKLHADPQQGKTLDIVLKKVKHRLVENMSSSTADALGLSRAILCNDTLVKKLQELQDTEIMYRGLVEHCKRVLNAHLDLARAEKAMGDVFAELAVREPQPRASEAFRLFGEQHRNMERIGVDMRRRVKPVLSDMGTYLYKAIPDTRLTVKKYADAKFEYLAYCLKVKEMDDEECSYAALQEPLYRVETGNYEYRLILRCRQVARARFARLRSDVLVKMELLDNKHVQSLGGHLAKLIKGLADLNRSTIDLINEPPLFPVEVDLSNNAFQYKSTNPIVADNEENIEDDDDIENGIEINEYVSETDLISGLDSNLISGLNMPSVESTEEENPSINASDLIPGLGSSHTRQPEPDYNSMDNLTLLSSLNLQDSPRNNSNNDTNSLLPDLIN